MRRTAPTRSTPDRGEPADPTVSDVGEFALIERITADRPTPPAQLLGPGDDAAVVSAPDGRTVVCTDVVVEGVHFRLDWSTPEQVGRKAVAANLADIAAMGAVTTALTAALACPSDTPVAVVEGLSAGMWAEAAKVDAGVVGGDLATAGQIVLSVTALGDLQGRAPVTRAGARPGDLVALCGRIGWSAAGLAVLGRGFRSPLSVVSAHRVPEPPYAQGPRAASAGATAMIDVSDGLLADAGHIAAASGVRIEIHTGTLAVPTRVADVARAIGADPMHWMLTGGEDHALLATFPRGRRPEGWTVIGSVVEGSGVVVDGAPYAGPGGWNHFRQ